MGLKRRLKRRVLCDVMNTHVGMIRTAEASTERNEYALRFMACSRCGRVVPIDMKPKEQVFQDLQKTLFSTPGDDNR